VKEVDHRRFSAQGRRRVAGGLFCCATFESLSQNLMISRGQSVLRQTLTASSVFMRRPLTVVILAHLMFFTGSTFAMQSIKFNSEWRFSQGDFKGAELPGFDDSRWQAIHLPHDWSIAGPIQAHHATGSPGGFFPAGVGWYRKSFVLPAAAKEKQVMIRFDGAYMLSEVWINGRRLGTNANGYTPFTFDLTPHLNHGSSNVMAVRVDNSRQMNSRWYSGSGIYRHVWLEIRDPLHVAPNGVWITTLKASENSANLRLVVTAENSSGIDSREVTVESKIYALDSSGNRAGTPSTVVAPHRFGQWRQAASTLMQCLMETEFAIANPSLWSPDHPSRYVAVSTLLCEGHEVDQVETVFGIRTIEVSANTGLLLNGQKIVLYGGNVHHDHGPLGAASFDRAEERRVELLKLAGFNAVRTSHNPPSTAFLDACDRLGLLVIDEIFDCWRQGKNAQDYHIDFEQNWRSDLAAMVLRDRNHPSVIIWSVGNEIPDLGSPQGLQTGREVIECMKSLDATRPVTIAVFWFPTIGGTNHWEWRDADEVVGLVDVAGYNYQIPRYAEDHQLFPQRVILSTESFPRDYFECWAAAKDNPWILGDFTWTAIDYLGESGIGRHWLPDEQMIFHGEPGQFPYHGAWCGDIDLTGFRKPVSHARNITWNRGEMLDTAVIEPTPDGRRIRVADWGVIPSRASWTWPGYEGKTLEVQVHSRCDRVQLYLNDVLIGEKPTLREDRFRATFNVPYSAGVLKTIGLAGNAPVAENTLTTAGPVTMLKLTPDRACIHANGEDVCFVSIEAVDRDGQLQPNADNLLQLTVHGAGSLAGATSGDFSRVHAYQGNTVRLFHGRAMAVIRSATERGPITLKIATPSLPDGEATLNCE
jgi:beta-galactosidase